MFCTVFLSRFLLGTFVHVRDYTVSDCKENVMKQTFGYLGYVVTFIYSRSYFLIFLDLLLISSVSRIKVYRLGIRGGGYSIRAVVIYIPGLIQMRIAYTELAIYPCRYTIRGANDSGATFPMSVYETWWWHGRLIHGYTV